MKIRKPAVAGQFYPGSQKKLSDAVDKYLSQAEVESIDGKLIALISPHAGYVFSAPVAAYAYKQIEGQSYDTVVLIGPSHRYSFQGAAVYGGDAFSTPLGEVEVDTELVQKLIEDLSFSELSEAHTREHSLEVQLPFLQKTLSEFKFVPILLSSYSESNYRQFSRVLASNLKNKNVLLIASTDLCHYPEYDEALKSDAVVISALKKFDPQLLIEKTEEYMQKNIVPNLHCLLCGTGAVVTTMETARALGANSIKILKHATSADVPYGTKGQAVGYLAAAMYVSEA